MRTDSEIIKRIKDLEFLLNFNCKDKKIKKALIKELDWVLRGDGKLEN